MAIDKLVDSAQLDADLTSVANAIRTKGGTSAQLSFPSGFVSAINAIQTGGAVTVVDTSDGNGGTIREITATNVTTLVEKTITENGTYNPNNDNADGYSSVIVNIGNVSVERSDVNFYDYDGTLLYAYTAAEALELTGLPQNPSHSGLTAQGWNYTLTEIKNEVTNNGICDIGQMYITNDGKTRFYCHFEDGRLSPMLGLCVDGTVVIDWGDDSATNTVTGTSTSTNIYTQHTYASSGDYIITLTVSSGTVSITGGTKSGSICESRLLRRTTSTDITANRVYLMALRKVELGSNVTLGLYAFSACVNLETVTIPNTITSIPSYGFYTCYQLAHTVIPNTVISIGTYAFYQTQRFVTFSLPLSIDLSQTGINIIYNTATEYLTFPFN